MHIGERAIPVILPKPTDPRLHLAAVIVTVHVIGITALGFEVSVPQIVSAIVTAALIDVAFTLFGEQRIVWPASGMLTGSGVALILRYVPTEAAQYWSWEGWYWFALVSGASVLTKHLIRWRGDHVFNPSNLGLVGAFLLVSSTVLEPLDFWWAPMGVWMLAAYVVIVVGGVLITRRLHLLEMAATYWVVLVAGLGVLAASGHCMIATWSSTPVCDARFWTALSTSPEVLIFLFFMITDPKTIPKGRTARVAFAATLAVVTTMMIAPHTLEYGAKVGLLASLVLWTPLRGLFDRVFSASGEESGARGLIVWLTPARAAVATFGRGIALGSAMVLLAIAIVLAGSPARTPAVASAPLSQEVAVEVDLSSLPPVTVDSSVVRLNIDIEGDVGTEVSRQLAEDLALEGEAVRYADASRLALADGGERLSEMQAVLDEAVTVGERPVDNYSFDSLYLREAGEAEGQTSAALAFDAMGEIEQIVYDPSGNELRRSTRPFEATFVMRQLGGERWSIVRVDGA